MAESNNDWIKVTDRLPESEKPVEITFRWKKWDNPDEYWYGTCNAFYEGTRRHSGRPCQMLF